MRLLVRMVLPISLASGRGNSYETFECVVQRVHKPVHWNGRTAFVHVDVDLPDQFSAIAPPALRNRDGTYQLEAVIAFNAKSLGAFLASDAAVLDLRDPK
ncbi:MULTISPECIES: hypothetical protein [Paraburkholderia]|uniref:hypothetical protein n=1 Tax=Paraburkholderia TaxID=1822464 RepID=UPI002257FF73|nr:MULTISPECIES: hypothetical protein [Paraburkholderia]MCX4154978.1 hypothetical protein [Paraburkholderia aspalathi]MDN7164388.1 hypothetical protein [Paraburkholderia sp. SECH2]MDQ6392873.1 hypothetical protein [Paraburkholderia aspalathi]